MPATRAELIHNPGNFVRDYPYAMDRTMGTPGVVPAAPANYTQATIALTIAARSHVFATAHSFFAIDNAPAPYQWYGTMNFNIQGEMVQQGGAPAGPGTLNEKRAYLLPWRTNTITEMTLGNNADYFFTSTLSGCSVYIHTPLVGPPTVYHANSGNCITTPANKRLYRNRLFQIRSGNPAPPYGPQVRMFDSDLHMGQQAVPTSPTAIAKANRKTGPNLVHGRRENLHWIVTGANVMGHRTGMNTWVFYWQTVGSMHYQRPSKDFNLLKVLSGTSRNVIHKWADIEVIDSGIV